MTRTETINTEKQAKKAWWEPLAVIWCDVLLLFVGFAVGAAVFYRPSADPIPPLPLRHQPFTWENMWKLQIQIKDQAYQLGLDKDQMRWWQGQAQTLLGVTGDRTVNMYFAPGDYGTLSIDKDLYEHAMQEPYAPQKSGFSGGIPGHLGPNVILSEPNRTERLGD